MSRETKPVPKSLKSERHSTSQPNSLILTPTIDLETGWEFVSTLSSSGQGRTFQTFSDSRGDRPDLVSIHHSHIYMRVATKLACLNQKGAGVFFTVNETDGMGRKSENIVRVRALFVDADNVRIPERWHLEPDFCVWRDPQHWHAYWLVNDCPLGRFADSQRQLARHYGTDPSVCDLPRVMRVPGFMHCKGTPTPVFFKRGGLYRADVE